MLYFYSWAGEMSRATDSETVKEISQEATKGSVEKAAHDVMLDYAVASLWSCSVYQRCDACLSCREREKRSLTREISSIHSTEGV